jgi:hypothetical protein
LLFGSALDLVGLWMGWGQEQVRTDGWLFTVMMCLIERERMMVMMMILAIHNVIQTRASPDFDMESGST